MSISQNSFDFGGSNLLHGVFVPQPADTPIQVYRIAGIKGETHLADKPKGRVFTLDGILRNYATWSLLMADIDAIDEKVGTLSGTLTMSGSVSATINRATFVQREQLSPPRYDGSGVHDWFCRIRLVWVQRSI